MKDKRLKYSLIYTIIIILILWLVKFYEYSLNISFSHFGIFPLTAKGLYGILLSPFIHGDFNHLISNTVPFFVLLLGLFYFYKNNAWKILFFIYILVGILVWLTARKAYHIGASGIVYGLASFHFFTGVLSKRKDFIAISLIIIFLYGSMIWGILPTKNNISWESHLMGFIIGIILSLFYFPKIKTEQVIIKKHEIYDDYVYDFQNINSTLKDIYIKYHQENTEPSN